MKKFRLFFLIIVMIGCNSNTSKPSDNNDRPARENIASQITTYYFIRHAEKDTSDPKNNDPELTETGMKRAQNWATVFKDLHFDVIYTSNYKRTRATARAVADTRQIMPEIYDSKNLYDEDFKSATRGKSVLVVGHSNTNPQFVNAILEQEKYKDIPDEESGSLFIVTLMEDGTKKSEVLYINTF